ncbi:MAG: helix-turn-helix transcriptional regulator [Candidatus Eremiobacteraeota bacterium]|nr:helix-turn-helix transcriptional regulator [Candidatus Eremiobacteraeota bacterium]MBV8370057.1 helix-turn-helix transcriptional regulator [Candidatus Eremiobacteraeota bacterium]
MKNRVRELRLERNWTQKDLGDRLGMSRQAIIAIENERFDPSLRLAIRMSRLFKKRVEEIFVADDR